VLPPGDDPAYRQAVFGAGYGLLIFHVDDAARITGAMEQTMTDRRVIHSTFSLERVYEASTGHVFAAWADPAAKARWFLPTARTNSTSVSVAGR
jgi:hypothetical protein